METGVLAGTRALRRPFGPGKGVLFAVGLVIASAAGSVLAGLGWGVAVGIQAGMHGAGMHAAPFRFPLPGLGFLAAALLSGELLAAVWTIGYPWYAARELFNVGDARGFGWRRATSAAYPLAAALALAAGLMAWGLTRLIPPDPAHLTGPLEELGRSHGWPFAILLLVGVGMAPFVEEFAFRGALLAAFARRYSTTVAVIVSTLLFVAMHAPDKIHYWPGFIDVGVMGLAAAGVRLRYQSVRPAMLLHFVYNALLLGLPAVLRWHGG